MIPFVTVDYDEEATDLNYRGVVLKVGSEEVKRANSGDFVRDYNEIIDYVRVHYEGLPCMNSSSVEHYIRDANLDADWGEDEE